MELHRLDPHIELVGDLAVGLPSDHGLGHHSLTGCQRRPRPSRSTAPFALCLPSQSLRGQAVSQLHQVADEVIAVETPEPFNAVGEWYLDFDHTSDQQMVNLLIESDATGIEASPRSA